MREGAYTGPIYEKWGGTSGRYLCLAHRKYVIVNINGYNFDRGGCSMVKVASHRGGGSFEPIDPSPAYAHV